MGAKSRAGCWKTINFVHEGVNYFDTQPKVEWLCTEETLKFWTICTMFLSTKRVICAHFNCGIRQPCRRSWIYVWKLTEIEDSVLSFIQWTLNQYPN